MPHTSPHAEPDSGANLAHRHPSYLRVFLTFARNSLVRDMTFRANFIIEMHLIAFVDGE